MATCKACQDPLVISLNPEDEIESGDEGGAGPSQEQGQTVPDDLELPCGCHYHWQCLLDQATEVSVSLKCPSCGTYLPANAGVNAAGSAGPFFSPAPTTQATFIPTRYTNEGGVQEGLDIFPVLTEEAYLAAHPEARPARAMHTMLAEGDVTGAIDVLVDIDSDGDTDGDAAQLLRWTDPLNGGRSALHVAIEAKQEEAFWLLLWLASGMGTDFFPPELTQTAQALGLPRRAVPANEDIRFIRDESGRSPRQLLAEMGPPWSLYAEDALFPEAA